MNTGSNTQVVIDCADRGIDVDYALLKKAGTPLDMGKLASQGITVNEETGWFRV